MLGTVGAAFVAAAVATWVVSPVYESRAVISIGRIVVGSRGPEPIEDVDVLVDRLHRRYRIGDRAARALPRLASARKIGPRAAHQLELVAMGRTAEEARDYLASVSGALISEHERAYERAAEARRRALTRLEERLERLRADIASFDRRLEAVREREPVAAVILVFEKYRALEAVVKIQNELDAARMHESRPAGRTEYILPPSLPSRAVRPDPHLYFSIALFLGVTGGVGAALTISNIRSRRSSARRRAPPDSPPVS